MKTKRKMPIRLIEQLVKLRHELKDGPIRRHVAIARIDYVLKWSNSEWYKTTVEGEKRK